MKILVTSHYFIAFYLLCGSLLLVSCNESTPLLEDLYKGAAPAKAPIIFDTDMGPDFDDVGALAVLHALAARGEANILATMSCNRHKNVAPAIDVINTYFGKPDIPIGAPKTDAPAFIHKNNWNDMIVAKYPHDLQSTDDASDAVSLYRQILARSADNSVTIITVGFLTNLENLLQSAADNDSSLPGADLVAIKVKKLVVMGGFYPYGKGFNLSTDSRAAKKVIKDWPGPILFSGCEIGFQIMTGDHLVAKGSKDSPVREAYEYCLKSFNARQWCSWDQTAVLAAVRGYGTYWDIKKGQNNMIGRYNYWLPYWVPMTRGRHGYLIPKVQSSEIAEAIENLMCYEP